MKDEVYRLAKPKKKGLLQLIFSRFLLIVVLILLQVAILWGLYQGIVEAVPYLRGLQYAFTLVMIVYLFNSGMDSTAKLTWMFIIAFLPLPGAALLLFTQTDAGHRQVKDRVARQIADTKDILPQDESVRRRLEQDGSGTDDLCTFLNRSGCFPVFGGTEATYLPTGEATFAALLEELKKAEKYIFLEFFIIEEGYMWGEVLRVLEQKVLEGVDVRVLYDGMCEVTKLPVGYRKKLIARGIRTKAFSAIRPLVSSHYNYRDHRKIAVIDGRVAFNGGVNLADEYINRVTLFGHWKDAAVMLKGEAVKSFTLMFLQTWNMDEREPVYEPYLADGEKAGDAEGFVMPYADCPLDDYKVGETVYIDILNRANDYVHIMTPYLILDGELEAAIRYAAQRGVDVKIILPGIPDKKMAYALAKSHYRSLVSAGVGLYEYTPGFLHSKVFVSDGRKAVVGTINLDYRSLYHHFECATYLYRAPCIADVEADFQETLARCRRVTPETIKAEKPFYKVAGSLMKFVAPLM